VVYSKTWQSHALWPGGTVTDNFGKCESHDNHYSKKEAEIVCKMLERDGLGGEGNVFPIKTWVTGYNENQGEIL
jgi:hypothetical protein